MSLLFTFHVISFFFNVPFVHIAACFLLCALFSSFTLPFFLKKNSLSFKFHAIPPIKEELLHLLLKRGRELTPTRVRTSVGMVYSVLLTNINMGIKYKTSLA